MFSQPRAITSGPKEHLFASYFGINAWSADGRYALVLETDVKNRAPTRTDAAILGVVDARENNRFIPLTETRHWDFDVGATAHWIGAGQIVFNDLVDGKPAAVVYDMASKTRRVAGPILSGVSRDGRWALTINFSRQGDAKNAERAPRTTPWPENDGLWLVDLASGEKKLIVSIASVRDKLPPPKDPKALTYFCHTVFNRDGSKIFWMARTVENIAAQRQSGGKVKSVSTAFTCNRDGSDVRRCFPDGWGGAHYNWLEGDRLLMTAKYKKKFHSHLLFTAGKDDYTRLGNGLLDFDGHCVMSDDGNWMATDTYADKQSWECKLMALRMSDQEVLPLGTFFVPENYRGSQWKCDLHPRWRPDGRMLGFNSTHEGSRQAYVIDVNTASLSAASPGARAGEDSQQAQIASAMSAAFDWQIAHRTTDTKVKDVHGPRGWVHGAFMTGVLEAWRATGRRAYLDYAWKTAEGNSWLLGRIKQAGDIIGQGGDVIGQSYLELAEIERERADIRNVVETLDRLLAQKHDGAKLLWFCDALYMHPQVWARLSKVTGDPKYLAEMDRLYWESVEHLYDRDEHLFYRDKNYMPHDKDFQPERARDGANVRFLEQNGRKMFWSRGNGWVFAGLPRIMDYLAKDDPRRAKYEALFKQLAARIAGLQSPDGLWRMGLLDPEAHGRGEASGSAFFVYGLAWGVRAGLLDAATYRPAAERGWRALRACQQPDGMVGCVQPIGARPGKHSEDTSQEYGTGGFLLAGSEMYKLNASGPGAPVRARK